MAGLVGIVDFKVERDRLQNLVSRMCQVIQHESWYHISSHTAPPLGLAQVSLDIFDPGSRPILNKDGSLCAMLDGEIYNPLYQPLKQHLLERGHRLQGDSHAELLLHLYEEQGRDFVQGINGSFNIVIWDSREQKLLIANDRYGSRPFYYHNFPTGFCFACEIKALLQDRRVKREVNEEAVIEFFTFRHVLGDKTPLVGIRYLPPATVLTYQDGQVTLHSYWTPPLDRQSQRLPIQDYVENLTHLLRQAVDRCMSGEHSTGFLLSGGMDSRLLVGLVDRRHLPFHTFTRGTPGCDDDRLGRMVADQVGSTHHFMEIPPDYLIHRAKRGVWLTDGLMTCVDFYALSTIEKVKEHVDAVCFGLVSGGLQGLGLSQALFDLDDKQLTDRIYAMRALLIQDWMQPRLFSESFYQRIRGVAHRNLHQVLRNIPQERSHIKAQYYFLRHYSPRAGMHGPVLTRSLVETRFPFADADLLDFVYTIPAELRMGREIQMEVLKSACPELAQIPWQFSGLAAASSTPRRTRFQRALYRARKELNWRTYGLIPLRRGREQADYPAWFRTVLRPWLEETLLGERTLARGYFDEEGINWLVKQHMSRRYDRTLQFGLLLTFELWNRLFIDGEEL
ncbi:MAG: asparagine synthase-related protein [Chloroflexota bacterium]|nr:asparagine synthase-related protein [Chloroflexota bacterium]